MSVRTWARSHRRISSRVSRLLQRPRLQTLWRPCSYLLTVLGFPGVLPGIIYVLAYRSLAFVWCKVYCGGWAPAWPARWRVYVLLLVATILFAALYLGWLLASGLVLPALLRARAPLPHRCDYDAQYMLLAHMEDGEGAEPDLAADSPCVRAASPLPKPALAAGYRSVWWWARVLVCAVVAGGGYWSAATYEHPGDIRYRPDLERALAHPIPEGYNGGDKIFIAAAFFNNEEVLPYWSATLLKVIQFLGTKNVFVSIVESNSGDGTRDLLRALDGRLADAGVRRRILIDDQMVSRPPQMEWNPRIEFLSAVRNRALEPLVEQGGFDKVLFSNDIFVEPESVIELLRTADGEYDMACSLDFGHFGAYDAWVLRDRIGRLTSTLWPYFLDAADYEAMRAEAPVPVFSCWNGIVALQADPFLPVHLRANRTLSALPLPSALPPTHPAAHNASMRGASPALTPPVRFRASAPGECFSSECFLLPYDLQRQFGLARVYANPRVSVAYSWKYYVWHKWVMRHWAVKWWVERVWDGAWMQYAMMVVGDPKAIFTWDGGECHPWW